MQTTAQAEELISIAAHAGRVLSVFQNRRWDGDFLTVQRIVRENLLGRLVEYEARWGPLPERYQAGHMERKRRTRRRNDARISVRI